MCFLFFCKYIVSFFHACSLCFPVFIQIFEVDDNNEYEEEVVTSSSLASALAGAAVLLLSTSPHTILLWKSLFTQATVMLDYLRAGLLAAPQGSDGNTTPPPRKYIGAASFEGEGFQRLYCGLSGAAQLVTRLNACSETADGVVSGVVSAKSPFVSALMTLRQDAITLLIALRRSEQAVHPLLIGQVQLIALADLSRLTPPKSDKSPGLLEDSTQRGSNRLASSYGNKKGMVL